MFRKYMPRTLVGGAMDPSIHGNLTQTPIFTESPRLPPSLICHYV